LKFLIIYLFGNFRVLVLILTNKQIITIKILFSTHRTL
jgi:hypothetical protein